MAAVESGYAIECDVQLSRDGEAMVFHDEHLDRLTASRATVGDLTSSELARIHLRDSADTIPTLPNFLAVIAGRVPLIIEIKRGLAEDFRLADRVLDLVADFAGPAVIESFDPAIVARCRGAPCPVGLVGPFDAGQTQPASLERCDFVSWSIDHLATIPGVLAALPATTWTVRTAAQCEAARRHGAQIVFEGFDPQTLS